MGVTIKYGGKFHTQRPLAELRRELETVAIDAARRWSAFLGLDDPELVVHEDYGGGALINFVNGGAESFDLWRPTTASNPEAEEYDSGGEPVVNDWRGYTKTQFVGSPLTHVCVCMTIKEIIDSGLFDSDSIYVKDEGEYFGCWFDLDNVTASIASNKRVLDSCMGMLEKVGWTLDDAAKARPDLEATDPEAEIFRAALEYELTFRDRSIYMIARALKESVRDMFVDAFELIRYPYLEHRMRDMQCALVVYLYRFKDEELMTFDAEEVFKFMYLKADRTIRDIAGWWTPEYAERAAELAA